MESVCPDSKIICQQLKIVRGGNTMSQDFCKDCGVLLSPNTSICPVCGFDNNYEQDRYIPADEEWWMPEYYDDTVPDNYPGY
jgi:uncharacterized Zn finger protein (UPF0148 family)